MRSWAFPAHQPCLFPWGVRPHDIPPNFDHNRASHITPYRQLLWIRLMAHLLGGTPGYVEPVGIETNVFLKFGREYVEHGCLVRIYNQRISTGSQALASCQPFVLPMRNDMRSSLLLGGLQHPTLSDSLFLGRKDQARLVSSSSSAHPTAAASPRRPLPCLTNGAGNARNARSPATVGLTSVRILPTSLPSVFVAGRPPPSHRQGSLEGLRVLAAVPGGHPRHYNDVRWPQEPVVEGRGARHRRLAKGCGRVDIISVCGSRAALGVGGSGR